MARKSKSEQSDEPPLTPSAIDLALLEATEDNNLEYVVFEYVNAYVFADPEKFDEALAELPKGLRYCWFITDINYQVLNGGFNQFFSNSSGQYALETLEALRTVGAKEAARILKRAIDIFEKKFGRSTNSRERMYWEPRDDPAIDSLDGCSHRMMLRKECGAAISVNVSPELLPAAGGETQRTYRQYGKSAVVLPSRARFT